MGKVNAVDMDEGKHNRKEEWETSGEVSSKPEEEESSSMAWSVEASVAGSLWRMAVMELWAVLVVAGYW